MSAARIAELATIALAEVGSTASVVAAPTAEHPFHVTGRGGPERRRAVMLAKLKVQGPDAITQCRLHAFVGLLDECGMVTVAEALLDRTCHKAMA